MSREKQIWPTLKGNVNFSSFFWNEGEQFSCVCFLSSSFFCWCSELPFEEGKSDQNGDTHSRRIRYLHFAAICLGAPP